MKKLLPVLIILLLVNLGAEKDGSIPAVPEIIRVAVYDNPPLADLDDLRESQSIYLRILRKIAELEDWELELVPGTWKEGLQRLEYNQVEVMTAIAYSEERAEKFLFSDENILINWGELFTYRGDKSSTINDFNGKKIGVLPDDIYYTGEEGIRDLCQAFEVDCEFVEFNSYSDIFRALEAREIQGGVANRLSGIDLESDFTVKKTSIIFKPIELRFAYPKDNSYTAYVKQRIDLRLKELKKDENSIYFKAILTALHKIRPETERFIRNFIIFIIIAAVISLVLFLWNWTLNRLIKSRTSELRESEKKYRQMYSMFRLMADNMPDMMWAKDLEMKYIFVNKAICESLLIASDTREPLGKTDLFFASRQRELHPENRDWHTFGEICTNSDEVVIRNKKNQRFDEFGNIRGEFLFLDVHKAPFLDENGEMIGTVGSARDVTKEKQLEKERKEAIKNLKERERFNFTLFNNIPVEAIVVDKEARIIKSNLALRTRRTRLPVLGSIMYRDYASKCDRDMYSELMDSMKTGKVKHFPEILYENDRYFSVTFAPLREGAIITAEDITDRILAEQQIEKLTRVFENLGPDPQKNIDLIVEQTNILLNGVCALYNRLDDESKSLCIWSISNKPEGLEMVDSPEGHICYEATIKNVNKPVVIPDLDATEYPGTDPNVRKFKLKSYLGYPVNVKGKAVGSLCIVDTVKRDFTDIEIKIISTLAKALSIEEERVLSRENLERSLNEKEILLKEIHHRVKNNMQIISSLLKLQTRKVTDNKTRELMQTSHQRVKTMALIHEKLYASSDLINIEFKPYVQKLTDQIFRHFIETARNIELNIDMDDFYLDISKAIPCGLIINELVTNCLKYAFPGQKKGTIIISLRKTAKDMIELVVKDNGIGLPDDLDLKHPDTLGLQLVQALTGQLHAELTVSRKKGTEYRIDFSLKTKKKKKRL